MGSKLRHYFGTMQRTQNTHSCKYIRHRYLQAYRHRRKTAIWIGPKEKTILFGATRISSPYKGANFAAECLNMLDPNRYEGLVIGRADADFISNLSIHVVQTGFLTEDKLIAAAYNACDTFIMTSIAESFGQVVLEAMSCGKPCVGFPTGGVVDLIRHNKSGYLTQGYDASELKAGIEWLFSDEERYNRLSHAARRQILNENSLRKY